MYQQTFWIPTHQATSYWTQLWALSLIYRDFLEFSGLYRITKNQHMVPPAGIEPALPYRNGILNPARLPVPPGGLKKRRSHNRGGIYAKPIAASIAHQHAPDTLRGIMNGKLPPGALAQSPFSVSKERVVNEASGCAKGDYRCSKNSMTG